MKLPARKNRIEYGKEDMLSASISRARNFERIFLAFIKFQIMFAKYIIKLFCIDKNIFIYILHFENYDVQFKF